MQKFSGPRFPSTRKPGHHSFTLVELLVAMAVFLILLALLLSMVSQAARSWQQVNGASSSRENARFLLELMGRDLETAVFPMNATNQNSLWFQMSPTTLNNSGYLNPAAAFWQATVSDPTAATNGDIQDVGYFVNWVADSTGREHGTFCRIQMAPANPDSIFANPATFSITPALLFANAPGLNNTNLGTANPYQGLLADNVMGLWITLYSTNMTILTPYTGSQQTGYSSRAPLPGGYVPGTTPSNRPAYADIGLVMMDPVVAGRISTHNLSSITNNYNLATNASSFLTELPASFRSGARSFTTRVQLKNVP